VAERRESVPGFLPLAVLVRPPQPAPTELQHECAPDDAVPGTEPLSKRATQRLTEADSPTPTDGAPEPLVEAACLRLRTLEWFERAALRLLRRFAQDVLARELLLAPVDIQHLAERAIAAFQAEEPQVISVAPSDAARLVLALPVEADPSLEPGDLAVDVAGGRLLSSLQLRMDHVIEDVLARVTTA
jgi:hypothetical protein